MLVLFLYCASGGGGLVYTNSQYISDQPEGLIIMLISTGIC